METLRLDDLLVKSFVCELAGFPFICSPYWFHLQTDLLQYNPMPSVKETGDIMYILRCLVEANVSSSANGMLTGLRFSNIHDNH
jgi:hypothetical protein